MGPTSKAAVEAALGALLVEARLTRGVLERLEQHLKARLDHEAQAIQADFETCNRRVSRIEVKLREHGISIDAPTPTPAE